MVCDLTELTKQHATLQSTHRQLVGKEKSLTESINALETQRPKLEVQLNEAEQQLAMIIALRRHLPQYKELTQARLNGLSSTQSAARKAQTEPPEDWSRFKELLKSHIPKHEVVPPFK